ncbi:MAG: hypothetical protein MUO72_20595 [Bacteroidales bacterium]|nr:hypothetical protein [Bacteroidales bacterium]
MKKIFTTIAAVVVTVCLFAQAPQKMSYQCVVRNSGGTLVANQGVGMKISILQGSPTGTLIYQEIYNPNPQTNANGLISLEIGGGIPLTETFSTIDWSSGPYFLKTETDPTGGTNYTIAGTSQLLSVPYALHAKTGENVTGIVAVVNGGTGATTVSGAKTGLGLGNVDNTTDLLKPVSTATQTALNLKAPLASPAFTGTPLAPTAAAGTNTTQVATTAFVTSAINTSIPAHYIGESYGGGIVFYIYDNGQHGLIAATADQSTGIYWFGTNVSHYTMALADGVGAGRANTTLIIASEGFGQLPTYAARICNEYSVTVGGVTYGDWYLPSKFELNLLYKQKSVVGGFTIGNYWSSTEIDGGYAWYQFFFNGGQGSDLTKGITNRVRAIRAF